MSASLIALPGDALEVMRGEPDRKRYLGGSDAAAIMGVGAYGRTPLTCYIAKTSSSFEWSDSNLSSDKRRFLERRKRWEGPIVEMLREEFDAQIVGINNRYRDPEYDFIAAEIDFDWRDHDGSIQSGEIKTVSPFNFGERTGWGDAGTADIPIHYAAQCMWGLGVTGRRTCIVAAMVGLDAMVFYRVERDEDTIMEMRRRAVHFWREHVEKLIPPDPISLADVMKLTLRMTGKPVELDGPRLALLEKLRLIRDSYKADIPVIEEIEFQLLDWVRKQWGVQAPTKDDLPPETAVFTFGGKKVGSWTRQRGSSLDQKQLKVLHPEIVKDLTNEYHFRVLRITKVKT